VTFDEALAALLALVGERVEVHVMGAGECGLCQGFAGEAVVGTDPLPPYHPSCTCTASAPV